MDMDSQVPPAAPEPEHVSAPKARPQGWMRHLPLIVLIVILIVAALVGFYLYGLMLNANQIREDAAAAATTSVSDASSSDLQETNSIEADLDSTNVDGSDSGVNNIDSNFQQ